MIANGVASVYGFLVLFLPAESLLWRLVLCFDVVSLKTGELFLLSTIVGWDQIIDFWDSYECFIQ